MLLAQQHRIAGWTKALGRGEPRFWFTCAACCEPSAVLLDEEQNKDRPYAARDATLPPLRCTECAALVCDRCAAVCKTCATLFGRCERLCGCPSKRVIDGMCYNCVDIFSAQDAGPVTNEAAFMRSIAISTAKRLRPLMSVRAPCECK
jgi:hypothetical protein